jgi:hypothetical protein
MARQSTIECAGGVNNGRSKTRTFGASVVSMVSHTGGVVNGRSKTRAGEVCSHLPLTLHSGTMVEAKQGLWEPCLCQWSVTLKEWSMVEAKQGLGRFAPIYHSYSSDERW